MSNFLLVYNRRTGDLRHLEFKGAAGRQRALKRRLKAEAARVDSDEEIVVISADSLEELMRTHGRYFRSVSQLARDAAQDMERGDSLVAS